MIALGLRVVAACRGGALIGYRPNSPAAHLVPGGQATLSGAWVRSTTPPLCGQRTRKLRVGGLPLQVVTAGRRFCRRCTTRLPWSLGRVAGDVMHRAEIHAAYGHLTIADLRLAAAWTVTVEDTHLVGRVSTELFGRAPMVRPDPARDPDRAALWRLNQYLVKRRDRLREAELTVEARADLAAVQDQRLYERGLIAAQQRRDVATEVALERDREGKYLSGRQQWLIDHAV